jgi:signal transduction histidine kinase
VNTAASSHPEDRWAGPGLARWLDWRRRAMVLVALAGCLGLFGVAHWLAGTPQPDASWTAGPEGQLVLRASPVPALQPFVGQTVDAVSAGHAPPLMVDALLLHHAPRWQPSEAVRERQLAEHAQVAAWLSAGPLRLHLADGRTVDLPVKPRGIGGLGVLFWPLAGLALLLYLFGLVVVLARPRLHKLLYTTTALCQAANLLLFALESAPGLGLPLALLPLEPTWRLALDAATGAAIVHALAYRPRQLAQAHQVAGAAWLAASAAVLALVFAPLGWWLAQGLILALGLVAVAVVHQSHRLEPNPYAAVMRRLGLIATGTLVLVTAAVAIAARLPGVSHTVAVGAAMSWYLFVASLVLWTPFLARSKQWLREFALLAGISTVAASVDLLFVAVFSLGPFTSLAVAVFVALAVYAGARELILDRMLGRSRLTTERIFEQIYKAAREVQAEPLRYPQLLARLLGDLFEPLEMHPLPQAAHRARVVRGGAALEVRLDGPDTGATPTQALALRFAQRGQRLFTQDDARLADRVGDLLRRAVVYDQAVERGRHEERLRIAQDLHDDIGARLLTLMYQARTAEMEDYIRHTLQDLKTLTRGLAASEHRLSHAVAEWKADLAQRLGTSQVTLAWNCSYEQDLVLSMVQWSALTRVLRELVSNALFHGGATRIEVQLQFETTGWLLRVADDGQGREPQAWSHGLGLGGVRKRVKLLGGNVQWLENQPLGIVCEARFPGAAQHS